jgi:hypothetical protein
LLRKINYLRWFIANLAGKVDSIVTSIQLKHENEFVLGVKQRKVFERIKEDLISPPLLRAPKIGKNFRLYIAAQEHVVGAMLMQDDGGKEFSVAYLSRRLLDTETRYTFIEKLCLSLYYLLSSSCR